MAEAGGAWWLQILEQISKGKRLALLALLASSVMLFGPKLFPTLSPYVEVPSNWKWLLAAVFLVSGFAVSLWSLHSLQKTIVAASRHPRINRLSACEQFILLVCTHHPQLGMALDDPAITAEYPPVILASAAERLEKRGLLELNPFSHHLVSLTAKGREYGIWLAQRPEKQTRW